MRSIFETAMEAQRRGELVVVHHHDVAAVHCDAPSIPYVIRGLAVTWCPAPVIGATPADDPPGAQCGGIDETEALQLLAAGATDDRDPPTH